MAQAKGTVNLVIPGTKSEKQFNFQDVLYVPDIRTNLMSVSRITDKDNTVTFNKHRAVVTGKHGDIKFVPKRQGGLYCIKGENVQCCLDESNGNKSLLSWYYKLGHLNFADVYKLVNKGLIRENIPKLDVTSTCCEVCLKGKITALPFESQYHQKN